MEKGGRSDLAHFDLEGVWATCRRPKASKWLRSALSNKNNFGNKGNQLSGHPVNLGLGLKPFELRLRVFQRDAKKRNRPGKRFNGGCSPC